MHLEKKKKYNYISLSYKKQKKKVKQKLSKLVSIFMLKACLIFHIILIL